MELTKQNAKRAAFRLKSMNVGMTYSAALDAFSHIIGYESWNVLASNLANTEKPNSPLKKTHIFVGSDIKIKLEKAINEIDSLDESISASFPELPDPIVDSPFEADRMLHEYKGKKVVLARYVFRCLEIIDAARTKNLLDKITIPHDVSVIVKAFNSDTLSLAISTEPETELMFFCYGPGAVYNSQNCPISGNDLLFCYNSPESEMARLISDGVNLVSAENQIFIKSSNVISLFPDNEGIPRVMDLLSNHSSVHPFVLGYVIATQVLCECSLANISFNINKENDDERNIVSYESEIMGMSVRHKIPHDFSTQLLENVSICRGILASLVERLFLRKERLTIVKDGRILCLFQIKPAKSVELKGCSGETIGIEDFIDENISDAELQEKYGRLLSTGYSIVLKRTFN